MSNTAIDTMEPLTSRLKLNYSAVVLEMQKSLRRGNPNTKEGIKAIENGCFCASELIYPFAQNERSDSIQKSNYNGKSNSIWKKWMIYADEDIGLADPYIGVWLIDRYILFLQKDGIDSHNFLMETCYVMMTSFKSRLCESASHISKMLYTSKYLKDIPELNINIFIDHIKNNREVKSLIEAYSIFQILDLPSDEKIMENIFTTISNLDGVNSELVMNRFELMRISGWKFLHFVSATLIAVRKPKIFPILIPSCDVIEKIIKKCYTSEHYFLSSIHMNKFQSPSNFKYEKFYEEDAHIENKGETQECQDDYTLAARCFLIEIKDKQNPFISAFNKARQLVIIK